MTRSDMTGVFIEKLRDLGTDWKTATAAALLEDVKAQTPVDTGSLRDSWTVKENGDALSVGSPQMNAVYTEFGTGLYALEGGGRKDKWRYRDAEGNWYTTSGKRPVRMLRHSYDQGRAGWIRNLEDSLKKLK